MKRKSQHIILNENISNVYSLHFLIFIIAFLMLSVISCSKNPVEPKDNTQPGRRDYVWTVDTIPVANSVMKDMWGSSPTNIWICGDGFDRRQSLWHYDGINFKPYNEYILSATSFCGFAQNNIWMATSTGRIYHFDGVRWKIDTVLRIDGYNDVVIQELYGTSPDNIYATGMAVSLDDYRGVIARYDGTKWYYLTLPNIRVNFYNIKYCKEENTYLLSGAHFNNPATAERLYTMKNNVLNEIYSGTKGLYMGTIKDRVYVYGDKIIYRYNGKSLVQFLNLSNTKYLGGVSGKSENDFFSNTYDYEKDLFGIGHWNGTDLATLYESNYKIYRSLFFENEVIFFSGNYYDEDINVIIKGKLK